MGEKFAIDQGASNWIIKTARKNHWRVQSWMDISDLIQDGYLCWYMVVERYQDRVENLDHMMKLFMRVYTNHLHDLASRRSRLSEQCFVDFLRPDQTDSFLIERLMPAGEESDAELRLMLDKAPPNVKATLDLFSTEDGRRKLQSKPRRQPNGVRETLNDRLCRLIGIDPTGVDLVGQVRDFLAGTSPASS